MSGAVIYLKKDLNILDLKVDIVLGVFNFCSLFGSLAGGRIFDWIGRRYTIALAGVLFLAGDVLMACASGYRFLSVGNLACSAGVGFAFMIAPVYTAKVAPASFRGFLATFPELDGVWNANWNYSFRSILIGNEFIIVEHVRLVENKL
ncbi:hypothetical protein TIFTF001_006810 [Ficus carica]|uniref:Major facilitator superfamily (MFS) profile domain-containing protein n=1 Tax=Ficus carica TaxID=3494 RepID=A0AA88CWE3_FICCA|nr:hypothetical protein TIFTF001_006810 [Ficus carica]